MKALTTPSDLSPPSRSRTLLSHSLDGSAGTNNAHALWSQHLLRGQKTVQIVHHDQVYVLQATRQGKLILTK